MQVSFFFFFFPPPPPPPPPPSSDFLDRALHFLLVCRPLIRFLSSPKQKRKRRRLDPGNPLWQSVRVSSSAVLASGCPLMHSQMRAIVRSETRSCRLGQRWAALRDSPGMLATTELIAMATDALNGFSVGFFASCWRPLLCVMLALTSDHSSDLG